MPPEMGQQQVDDREVDEQSQQQSDHRSTMPVPALLMPMVLGTLSEASAVKAEAANDSRINGPIAASQRSCRTLASRKLRGSAGAP